jgi:aminoglycoside 2''-phosphotransferase
MNIDSLFDNLAAVFPHIVIRPPLRLLDDGFSSFVFETANGIVFRVGRTQAASAAYQKENRLLPLLQQQLPVPVPLPICHAAQTEHFPYGVIGYHKLPGVSLAPEHITSHTRDALIAGIAEFLYALHRFPAEAAFGTGLDSPPPHRLRYMPLRDAVMPTLERHLAPLEYADVMRWWASFLDDARMTGYPHALIHGDFWYGNLLVNHKGELAGVLDFENAALDDIAQDFAALRYLGDDFTEEVIQAYQALGGAADPHFSHRWERRWQVREFEGIRWSIAQSDGDELAESITKLRNGPILG